MPCLKPESLVHPAAPAGATTINKSQWPSPWHST
jgi:hypothetical protein